MKLAELYQDSYDATTLSEEVAALWDDRGQLDEGIFDSLKSGYQGVATAMTKILQSSGKKDPVNDEGLRSIYQTELGKLESELKGMPPKAASAIKAILAKQGIRTGTVDVSRKHLNRIMILKLTRLVMFAMKQMRDNGAEWIISTVVSGGIGAIFSAISVAKDAKGIAIEFKDSSNQIRDLFKIANKQVEQ